jgi:signal transduction histidine kinase
VSWIVAIAGWGLAVALACSMRGRMSLVADAEHELRGAAAAIGLAAERGQPHVALVRLQVDRMGAALADLAAARGGRSADPRLDAGRLAQVLGNLGANAVEHGVGPVRIEIRNGNRPLELEDVAGRAGRGRGLAIASRAARELGGELRVEAHDGHTRATLELPGSSDGASRTA